MGAAAEFLPSEAEAQLAVRIPLAKQLAAAGALTALRATAGTVPAAAVGAVFAAALPAWLAAACERS